MNTVGHVEIPAENINRVKDFYSNLFDWEWNYIEEMDYHIYVTKDKDGNVPAGGGIVKKENANQSILNYVNVDDIASTAAKIEELGGNVIVPKTAVPGMGWMLHFQDTEGNLMALWENDKEAK